MCNDNNETVQKRQDNESLHVQSLLQTLSDSQLSKHELFQFCVDVCTYPAPSTPAAPIESVWPIMVQDGTVTPVRIGNSLLARSHANKSEHIMNNMNPVDRGRGWVNNKAADSDYYRDKSTNGELTFPRGYNGSTVQIKLWAIKFERRFSFLKNFLDMRWG